MKDESRAVDIPKTSYASWTRPGVRLRWQSIPGSQSGSRSHVVAHAAQRVTLWAAWFALVAVALLLLAPAVTAQEPTLDEINAVARELYCPLCNGVRLDTCDLQACIQMRQVIRDKLAAGVPTEQIKADFVAQYGPVVLGEPPRKGLDLLAWILPIGALILGGGWLLMTILRWTHKPAPADGNMSAEIAPREKPTRADATDAYLDRIEQDLAQLD